MGTRIERLVIIPLLLALVAGATGAATARSPDLTPSQIRAIVDTYAKSQVDSGAAIGVEVGITLGSKPPHFFSYGLARYGTSPRDRERFTEDTLFQIGSVTKIFTTNLLGQLAAQQSSVLSKQLSQFASQLGTLPTNAGAMTLNELGDFTSGITVSTPPQCTSPSQQGTGCICVLDLQTNSCTLNDRPTVDQYDAQDLVDYYRNLQVSPPPGPYFYSDVSTGIIGLLLGGRPRRALDNSALAGWSNRVDRQLTHPLGMKYTFLNPPSGQSAGGVAGGYDQALVTAQVSSGQVTGFDPPSNGGSNYLQSIPPTVAIVGGGGKGATAHAVLSCPGDPNECTVASVETINPGGNYIPAPMVSFGAGDAIGEAVVADGKMVGVLMQKRGCYSTPPSVTISGGRLGNGRDATAQAVLWHQQVAFVEITDGGAGYVEPLAVLIEPGQPFLNNIPIWAPAGALSSTARDMMILTEAALDHPVVNGRLVPPLIRRGFQVAETSYAQGTVSCQGAEVEGSGLAWAILPADANIGKIIVKNGGIGGFSTVVFLVPSIDLGIVVLINSRTPPSTAEQGSQPTSIATDTGLNIIFAIFHAIGVI
jgi:CubicO group peptidase (beta-lactamase class C family)